MNWMFESRSDNYYDEGDEGESNDPSMKWYEFPLFLLCLILAPYVVLLIGLIFALGLIGAGFRELTTDTAERRDLKYPWLAYAGVILAFILATSFSKSDFRVADQLLFTFLASGFIIVFTLAPLTGLGLRFVRFTMTMFKVFWRRKIFLIAGIVLIIAVLCGPLLSKSTNPMAIPSPVPVTQPPPTNTNPGVSTLEILVDDFQPQPYQGDAQYYYNRLDGDRGGISDTRIEFEQGQMRLTIAPGSNWGGMWLSLNHPIREGKTINFSAILPMQIRPEYQPKIIGIQIRVKEATSNSILKIELKNGDQLLWAEQTVLSGDSQLLQFKLTPLNDVNHLVLVLEQAQAGDYVVIERLALTAETQTTDTATAAFVWSYGMLLENWNPHTGLVRDKARDASGEFDALQATGNLASVSATASQLGVISRVDAVAIVEKIADTLLHKIPRYHGLLPHWVKTLPDGQFVIVEGTEWSSVDTVIAALGLLEAQASLGLDTSATEQLLIAIDWNNLVTANGISHGYTYGGELIPYAWDVFGGESWLVQWAYASVTGQIAPLAYPSPPTANGSGFIDELAWLYVAPPKGKDVWGTNWTPYRKSAAKEQIAYYPITYPDSCFAKLGLFGLSAGEVPAPWLVEKSQIYQAYGIGGAFTGPNDGSGLGAPVIAPHYSAMIASIQPKDALKMWDWLIANRYFTPLNNVESLMFNDNGDCAPANTAWNHLKGSWNLSLQALGWGRYLAEQRGGTYPLWQAVETNPFLKEGYRVLTTKP